MERVAVRFVLTAAVLGLLACNKNVDRDGELVISKPGETGTAPLSAEGSGGVLEGTVSLAPALAAKAGGAQVLFIIARRPEGGPPLAVKKITSPSFPLRFQLTNSDVMMEGFELSGQVLVGARLDADGAAGPAAAGDLMGVTLSPVTVGGPSIDLVIDQEFGAAAPTTVKLPEAPPGDTMAARQAELTGTIQVDPSLAAEASSHPALFIIARSGAGGPPLAAQRIAAPTFPYSFRMTAQDVMMQGREFSGPVTVTARLDADGAAGPAASGDLTGSTAAPVDIGGPDVEIVINQRVP